MKTIAFLCLSSCIALIVQAKITGELARDDNWEFLLLAQFWPGSSCVYFRDQGCAISPDVKGWTIHGLWPSREGSQQPEFCNKSMPFNYTEIEVLQEQLDSYWPYYNKSGARTELWEHEWNKHGTCAYVLPAISGELKYFSTTLKLYHTLNIYDTLSGAGIVPTGDKLYHLSDVFTAVKGAYGTIPQIECYYAEGKHYLDQVWLCYDKTLSLQDCPKPSHSTYRHLRSQDNYVQKTELNIYFESEKPSQEGTVQVSKSHSYFVDCPKNEMVYYIPVPQN
ncbi:unnamed protein product [Candidula unifasciata]|uniref:Uncharacterized protein n=1 Tax=Candidula unifasciata TaxID=100452 RepID=A0A8S4A8Z4_9EUPU|nr:unnamed protein product [Candidula unifasciata]